MHYILYNLISKLINSFPIIFILLYSVMINSQGLRKSHHDFSHIYSNANEICKPCHLSKNTEKEITEAPLWGYNVNYNTFQMYTSQEVDESLGQPNGVSKLCLTCHDGTYASDGHKANYNSENMFGIQNLKTSLNNNHPISFVYDTSLAENHQNLNDPSNTPSGLGGTIENDLLKNNKMECVSCHDVHVFRNTQGDCSGCHEFKEGVILNTTSLSLWKSNNRSALCFVCHKK